MLWTNNDLVLLSEDSKNKGELKWSDYQHDWLAHRMRSSNSASAHAPSVPLSQLGNIDCNVETASSYETDISFQVPMEICRVLQHFGVWNTAVKSIFIRLEIFIGAVWRQIWDTLRYYFISSIIDRKTRRAFQIEDERVPTLALKEQKRCFFLKFWILEDYSSPRTK